MKKMKNHETSFHLGQILGAKIASQAPVTEVETPPPPLCNVTKVTFCDKCEEIKGGEPNKNPGHWTMRYEREPVKIEEKWQISRMTKIPKSVTFVMFSEKQPQGLTLAARGHHLHSQQEVSSTKYDLIE